MSVPDNTRSDPAAGAGAPSPAETRRPVREDVSRDSPRAGRSAAVAQSTRCPSNRDMTPPARRFRRSTRPPIGGKQRWKGTMRMKMIRCKRRENPHSICAVCDPGFWSGSGSRAEKCNGTHGSRRPGACIRKHLSRGRGLQVRHPGVRFSAAQQVPLQDGRTAEAWQPLFSEGPCKGRVGLQATSCNSYR